MYHGHELALSFPPMHPSKPKTSLINITGSEILSFPPMYPTNLKQAQSVSKGSWHDHELALLFPPMHPSKPKINPITITGCRVLSFIYSPAPKQT